MDNQQSDDNNSRAPTKKVWVEDDATPGLPGHEGLGEAFERLYGKKWDPKQAISKEEDYGDCVEYVMPDGIIVLAGMRGYSEIHETIKTLANAAEILSLFEDFWRCPKSDSKRKLELQNIIMSKIRVHEDIAWPALVDQDEPFPDDIKNHIFFDNGLVLIEVEFTFDGKVWNISGERQCQVIR